MNKQRVAYTPTGGVCSKMMIIDSEDNVGMEVGEAIRRLEGIDCRGRGTSCPDQLAQALKQIS